MPSETEPRVLLRTILLRATLYALVAAALVIFAPAEPHVFIYWGF